MPNIFLVSFLIIAIVLIALIIARTNKQTGTTRDDIKRMVGPNSYSYLSGETIQKLIDIKNSWTNNG